MKSPHANEPIPDQAGFSPSKSAILLRQPNRSRDIVSSSNRSLTANISPLLARESVDKEKTAESTRLSPKENGMSQKTSSSPPPWATLPGVNAYQIDPVSGKTVLAPLTSETREAQLSVTHRDPKQFAYFYNKHLAKTNSTFTKAENKTLLVNTEESLRSPSQNQSQSDGKSIPIPASAYVFDSNASKRYQVGPSKFFGEYEALKLQEAREKREAQEIGVTSEGDKNESLLTTSASLQPSLFAKKRLFPNINVSHVLNRKANFLQHKEEKECRPEGTSSTQASSGHILLPPIQSSSHENTTDKSQKRKGPRVLSEAFKEQLKNRKTYETLSYSQSHRVALESKDDSSLYTSRKGQNSHSVRSGARGHEKISPSEKKVVAGVGIASAFDDTKHIRAREEEKAQATKLLFGALSAQRKNFEENSLLKIYEQKRVKGNEVEALDTVTIMQSGAKNSKKRTNNIFGGSLRFHRVKQNVAELNGTKAVVVGGLPWGEPLSSQRTQVACLIGKSAERQLDKKVSETHLAAKLDLPKSKRNRNATTTHTKLTVNRGLSPSTQYKIQQRAKKLLREGVEGLQFHRQLISQIKRWDEWCDSTRERDE